MTGHKAAIFQLRPDQREAILALAEKRREPGKPPPISEVVRQLLDKALGLKPPR
jgi:hypothetical protein